MSGDRGSVVRALDPEAAETGAAGTELRSEKVAVPDQGAGPTAILATNVDVGSSTEITATTGGSAEVGTWNLFVITAEGTSAASSSDVYLYY